MMNRQLVAAIILAASVLVPASATPAEELCIASWNCENLFDTVDDPKVQGDEEYTPESKKKWTKERLGIKLTNLSSIISKMNDGKGPDVIGLCEIENRKVVELLVEMLHPLGRKYEIIHKDSPSERGIDCAIVFDSGVFTLADSKFHHVDAENTRDIVEAKLHRKDNDLYVFMDHWPSRHHEESFREKAADVARKRIDEILAADPKADIIMLGDFNDETTDPSIKDHLRTVTTAENLPPGTMLDTTAHIKAEGKGTFVYDNKWDQLDHIIVSPGLLDSAGFRWKEGSSQALDFPELFYQPKFPGVIKRPSSSFTRDDFHKNGYSDHLPLNCILVQ
jgi:endonuclease/exonuclease/phosphatase family metal-dependent hydrolase